MSEISFPILLAKNSENPDSPLPDETLLGHTKNVCEAAILLSQEMQDLFMETLYLTKDEVYLWNKALLFSAWAHDLGKANDQFQQKIRRQIDKQSVRHETISLLIFYKLQTNFSEEWHRLPEWIKVSIYFAIAGHHLKYPDPDNERPVRKVNVTFEHPDFISIIKYGFNDLKLPISLNCILPNLLFDTGTFAPNETSLIKALKTFKKELPNQESYSTKDKTLIASVKVALMSADLAGSALPEKSTKLQEWLLKRIGKKLTRDNLQKLVITKLGANSVENRLRSFQKEICESKKRTILLEAACGSGKTAGAYLWASKWAAGRRLFFCYPTTTTASEGFSGYMRDPDFDPILIHSRASIDYRLLQNMPSKSDEENELYEARLEALETWPAEAVVCTAHAVLGLLENNRRSILAWNSIIRSAFVFDEIHSYSNRVFKYLLRFIDAFPGAPVLLMTATLPSERRDALIKIADRRGGIEIYYGPRERESAPRYNILFTDKEDIWAEIESVMRENGKALWICNTVNRAMEILDIALRKNLPVKPFHSRFIYRDRLARQNELINSFKDKNSSLLAVTTQVAEISLDLSADLLVSEVAPIPAMIQRMGRLNRFEEIPEKIKTALFYEPESKIPYVLSEEEKEEENASWEAAYKWIKILADGKPKSQLDLANIFLAVSPEITSPPVPVERCEWLDGLLDSSKQKRSIEEPGYNIEVIRHEDRDKKLLDEYVLPMPPPPKFLQHWSNWKRVGRFLIAPPGAIEYSEFRGGKWKKQ